MHLGQLKTRGECASESSTACASQLRMPAVPHQRPDQAPPSHTQSQAMHYSYATRHEDVPW